MAQFYQSYQAANPGLQNLQFSSDFRVAFVRKGSYGTSFPLPEQAVTVELSAEERQKAESLHREALEAKRAFDEAQKNWSDYWHQLVIDHVSSGPESGGMTFALPSGKPAVIPFRWTAGVVFTPDFRVGVPRSQ